MKRLQLYQNWQKWFNDLAMIYLILKQCDRRTIQPQSQRPVHDMVEGPLNMLVYEPLNQRVEDRVLDGTLENLKKGPLKHSQRPVKTILNVQ